MQGAIVALAGTDKEVVDIMAIFIRYSAKVVSVTDSGLAGQPDRFHVFGVAEDSLTELRFALAEYDTALTTKFNAEFYKKKFTVVVAGVSWSITLHLMADDYDEAISKAGDYLDKTGKDCYDVVSVFDGWLKDHVSSTELVKE